jgi:polar amino acid transport system substrate-binding protein
MVMLGLAACGSEKTASSTVPTVVDGVLTMGTNAQFPPYEFYDGDQIVGIDAEIAQAIADKLGLKLEITDMDFGSIITSVQAGKVDVGIAGMTVNEERLQNVNFSTSYATGVQAIIVKEDSDIASPDDLAGKLIGVQENTTGHIYCEDDFGTENVIAYTNGATAVQALAQGKVDCVVIDNEPAKNFVSTNEGLKILNTEYVTEDYAIAISKDNEELLNAVDGALKELIADGTVQTILDKYIKAE